MTAFRFNALGAAFVAATLSLSLQPSFGQDIADTHLRAARGAISAIQATDQFDLILPQAAGALKAELIQKDPNLQDLIARTVDEKTLELAGRRADLEREAALAYARVFTEEELTQIAAFYSSAAGKKLIADGPIVTRQVIEAAEIWQTGVARDLAQSVAQVLAAAAPQQPAGSVATPPPAEAPRQ